MIPSIRCLLLTSALRSPSQFYSVLINTLSTVLLVCFAHIKHYLILLSATKRITSIWFKPIFSCQNVNKFFANHYLTWPHSISLAHTNSKIYTLFTPNRLYLCLVTSNGTRLITFHSLNYLVATYLACIATDNNPS